MVKKDEIVILTILAVVLIFLCCMAGGIALVFIAKVLFEVDVAYLSFKTFLIGIALFVLYMIFGGD